MLFKRKQPAPVAEYGYQDAVDYLRDLEQVDYTKILKVVKTYREADKKVKRILNIKAEAVEDADIADLLLLDDAESPASKQQRKTAEKAIEGKKK